MSNRDSAAHLARLGGSTIGDVHPSRGTIPARCHPVSRAKGKDLCIPLGSSRHTRPQTPEGIRIRVRLQAYRKDVPYRSRAHRAPPGVSTISDLTHHGHIPARCHPDPEQSEGGRIYAFSTPQPGTRDPHPKLPKGFVSGYAFQAYRKDVPYRSRAHRAPLPRHG